MWFSLPSTGVMFGHRGTEQWLVEMVRRKAETPTASYTRRADGNRHELKAYYRFIGNESEEDQLDACLKGVLSRQEPQRGLTGMARGKRKNAKKDGPTLNVEEVLSGRVRPTAKRLVELIRRINPTGDSPTAGELTRRYGLKSRLQSLYVDNFKDDVEIRPGSTEGTVLLVHRPTGANVGHAIVADLEPDARSWVQWQIDEAASVGSTQEQRTDTKTPSHRRITVQRGDENDERPKGVETLLRLGRDALEAYDYQEAEVCFEKACSQEPGNADAAAQLLEFFVEHLGTFEKGLALISNARFPLTDKIRVLGALAAARTQRFDEASTLALGVSDERLSEVWLSKADDAIRTGRWSDATEAVETARTMAPNDMGYLSRDKAIDEGRAAERKPLELALQTLIGKGLYAEAEVRALALLESWPDSSSAKRVLARVDAQKRRTLLSRELQLAENAQVEGDDFATLVHFRKAIDLGADKEKVLPKIAAAQASLDAKEETSQVDHAVELLSFGGTVNLS